MARPGWGLTARWLAAVPLLTVLLPLMAWTGWPWLAAAALIMFTRWGALVASAAFIPFAVPNRWVVLLAWAYVAAGTLVCYVPAAMLLPGSSWGRGVAIACGVVGGLGTYVAACHAALTVWAIRYLPDYKAFQAPGGRFALPSGRPGGRAAFSPRPDHARAEQLADLRPPPFRPPGFHATFHLICNEIAELQIQVAAELMESGARDRALRYCTRATALRRRILAKSPYPYRYPIDLADALASEARCLAEADRLTDAVAVGEEELDIRRRLHTPRGDEPVAPSQGRDDTTTRLSCALLGQSERLRRLGRNEEAVELAAEAWALD